MEPGESAERPLPHFRNNKKHRDKSHVQSGHKPFHIKRRLQNLLYCLFLCVLQPSSEHMYNEADWKCEEIKQKVVGKLSRERQGKG